MQVGRNSLFALALAASAGAPYLLSMTPRDAAPSGETAALGAAEADLAPPPALGPALPIGPQINDLGEVFRFDVTPEWVIARWPRVFTNTPEAELRGYRVALVSGTSEDDLAGALTYYFDEQRRLRRIKFLGGTGDTRPLVRLLTARHGFLPARSDDPGLQLYQVRYDGRVRSELKLRPTSVVVAGQPHSRYQVELWFERPNEFRMLQQDERTITRRFGP